MFSAGKTALVVSAICLLCSCQHIDSNSPASADSSLIQKAEKESRAGNWETAEKLYLDSLKNSEAKPESAAEAKKKIARFYYDYANFQSAQAQKTQKPELLAQALSLLVKAETLDPKLSVRCSSAREDFEKELKAMKYRNATSLATLDPNAKNRDEKIAVLLKQGQTLSAAGNYDEAIKKYEEILILNPYNQDAPRELKKVHEKSLQVAKERASATRAEMMSEAEWRNVKPIQRKEEESNTPGEKELPKTAESPFTKQIFAELNFKDTLLADAMSQLEKDYNKSFPENPITIRFQGMNPADLKWPSITFSTKKISLKETLDSICTGIGLKYEVSGQIVSISPQQ